MQVRVLSPLCDRVRGRWRRGRDGGFVPRRSQRHVRDGRTISSSPDSRLDACPTSSLLASRSPEQAVRSRRGKDGYSCTESLERGKCSTAGTRNRFHRHLIEEQMIGEILASFALLLAVGVFGVVAWRLSLHVIGVDDQDVALWRARFRERRNEDQ